jgi:Type II secretion system (T2SS), protein G
MRRPHDEVNTRTHFATSFFFFASIALHVACASSCGGADRRADRLWRQAEERVQHGDTEGAVDRLQKIIDQYPGTPAAERAEAQIVVYRGLLSAVQEYPSRRAHESMVVLARAIEVFRRQKGRVPAALDDVAPSVIASVPMDPWNRPFSYEATATGYRLSCLGADGVPGGVAESRDLLVVDGEFLADQP